MSFYALYQQSRDISPVVRGLARLIEGGQWIHWSGLGLACRKLSPGMAAKWGQSLEFWQEDRDVRWPDSGVTLNAAEKEHLYAIYERVYLIPERERAAAARAAEARQTEESQRAWREQLEQLEQIGSAA